MSGMASLSYIGRSNEKMDAQFASMELHVTYLRSLEDSPRVRAASTTYLQNWLFYSIRRGLISSQKRSDSLRRSAGNFTRRRCHGSNAWIRALFGWRFAKRAMRVLPQVKWSVVRMWDKGLMNAQM